jgi:hypothetical protein
LLMFHFFWSGNLQLLIFFNQSIDHGIIRRPFREADRPWLRCNRGCLVSSALGSLRWKKDGKPIPQLHCFDDFAGCLFLLGINVY